MIVGIDEVGRGAWAGPLVVGAVLLGDISIKGLTDSKLLTRQERETLNIEIRKNAIGVGLGWVSAHHVDQMGLTEALKLASRRAISHIHQNYDEIVIDGTIKFLNGKHVRVMKKADLLVPSVSAASIVAKVARDNYMRHIDGVFPGYSFESHVGYGTKQHRDAIRKLGVTPIHRLSYAPLMKYRVNSNKTNYRNKAKKLAVEGLESRGHRVLGWLEESSSFASIHNGELYFTTLVKRAEEVVDMTLRTLAAQVFVAENDLYGSKTHFLKGIVTKDSSGNILDIFG